jgi:hypothetical protein
MTCITQEQFDWFMGLTGLEHDIIGSLVKVHSQNPALWQIVEGLFCFSRSVLGAGV